MMRNYTPKWITTLFKPVETYCSWGLTRSRWRTWRHITRLCRYTRSLTCNIRWAWTWANRWHSCRMRTGMCTKARVHGSCQSRTSRWRWLNRGWVSRCSASWGNITTESSLKKKSNKRRMWGEYNMRTRFDEKFISYSQNASPRVCCWHYTLRWSHTRTWLRWYARLSTNWWSRGRRRM